MLYVDSLGLGDNRHRDNIGKLYADAAEAAGVLPEGDERIADGRVVKVWGETGGVLIEIYRLPKRYIGTDDESDTGACTTTF